MNLQKAMDYARNADFETETIACLCKWMNLYCAFILKFEIITDEEPEDNGPRYIIEYVGSKLSDPYSVEGEHYTGANLEELTDDIIDLISPDRLNFQVYQRTTDAEVIPFIYHDLLPDMMLDYEKTFDMDFYHYQVDRVLHHLTKQQ